jgi:hypothetical protein
MLTVHRFMRFELFEPGILQVALAIRQPAAAP